MGWISVTVSVKTLISLFIQSAKLDMSLRFQSSQASQVTFSGMIWLILKLSSQYFDTSALIVLSHNDRGVFALIVNRGNWNSINEVSMPDGRAGRAFVRIAPYILDMSHVSMKIRLY